MQMNLRVFYPLRTGPYPAMDKPAQKWAARSRNKHTLCTALQLEHTEETA